MQVLRTVKEAQQWRVTARDQNLSVGLVPTMGALHQGHFSLVSASVNENDLTVVTIFVNPIQFGPHEDLEKYPRTWEQDLKGCQEHGADVVYAPSTEAMYSSGFCTYIEVSKLTDGLCGAHRPGHFRGVTTVVMKLFHALSPTRAYFGKKDFQQAQVIDRMVTDLDMDIELRKMPIVRDMDGLAMSSRNKYLSLSERQAAPLVFRGLQSAQQAFVDGETDAEKLCARFRAEIKKSDLLREEYVEVVDPLLLKPVGQTLPGAIMAVAVRCGETRLIDNIELEGL